MDINEQELIEKGIRAAFEGRNTQTEVDCLTGDLDKNVFLSARIKTADGKLTDLGEFVYYALFPNEKP